MSSWSLPIAARPLAASTPMTSQENCLTRSCSPSAAVLPNSSRRTVSPIRQTAAPARSSASSKVRPDASCQLFVWKYALVDAGDAGRPVASVADDGHSHVQLGSHGLDAADLRHDRLCIAFLERRGASGRTARPQALPGTHHQQIAAQAGNLILDRLRCAVAQRHHRDDGADADDDARGSSGTNAAGCGGFHAAPAGSCFSNIRRIPLVRARSRPSRARIEHVAANAAIDEMNHPLGICGHVRIMRDHDDGDARPGIELDQQFHHFPAARRIEIARGLVGEQDRRRGDDGPGDGHALLLPARQFAGGMALPAREPHRRQRFAGQRDAAPYRSHRGTSAAARRFPAPTCARAD